MLHPKTIIFLRHLKKNNDKTWFNAHKEQYESAKFDFAMLTQRLINGLGQTDPALGSLKISDCVFRIYKDIHFSVDKTPYKVHFAAGFNQGGKKVHYPGYYFHLEPGGKSFCGGGIWHPDVSELRKIRQEIDYNYKEFLSIIQDRRFVRRFGHLKDEAALVRAPYGYSEDNPAIAHLRFRNYIAGAAMEDTLMTDPRLEKKILDGFAALKPLVDFLGRALA